MPVITLLELQKNNKERVNVYLDGEYAFGLNIMDAVQLRKGQLLTDTEITEIQYQDEINKAVEVGVNLLSFRPRSIQEIRKKLLQKDKPEAVVDVAIERMLARGYLDDRAFAQFWIEDRNRHKPRGKRALSYELRGKGVADNIIRELLDDMVDEQDAAYQAAQTRVRRMQGSTEQEFKQKIGAYLQRRGFGFEAVNQVLSVMIEELQAADDDFFAQPDDDTF